MNRISLLLLAAVVASAMMLVRSAYDSRRLFAELHRAESQHQELLAERRRLEAERQLQATNQKVQRTALERLHMRPVDASVTLYEAAPERAPQPMTEAAAAAQGARR